MRLDHSEPSFGFRAVCWLMFALFYVVLPLLLSIAYFAGFDPPNDKVSEWLYYFLIFVLTIGVQLGVWGFYEHQAAEIPQSRGKEKPCD